MECGKRKSRSRFDKPHRINLTKEKKLHAAKFRTATVTKVEEKAVESSSKIKLQGKKIATGKINEIINVYAGMIGRQVSYRTRDRSR